MAAWGLNLNSPTLARQDAVFRFKGVSQISRSLGCHLTGGRISLIGTLFGAFMLRGIQSFLILLAVQPQWYILVVGLIVVLASLADRTLTSFALKK